MAAVVSAVVPNVWLFMAPHVSIEPVVAGLCAAGLLRSQSGAKLLLLSVHERDALVAMRPIGFDRM